MTTYAVAVDDVFYVDADDEKEAKKQVQENIGSDDFFVDSPRVIEEVDSNDI